MDADRITLRQATEADLDDIVAFVDYWLSGLARRDGLPEGGKDYFVPRGRHHGFIIRNSHNVLLAIDTNHIVGWAVVTRKNSLIHLLISGQCRGQGIGRKMLELLNPDTVRSKIDQSTGDPTPWYLTKGYIDAELGLIGKHENIRILKKPGVEVTLKTTADQRPKPQPHPQPTPTYTRTIDRLRLPQPEPPKYQRDFSPTQYLND